MSRDTWTTRDYPVLLAVADHLETTHGDPIEDWRLARKMEADARDVTDALAALIPGYVTGDVVRAAGGPAGAIVTGLTEKGRRASGLWPADDHTAALVAAILAAAEQVDDEHERSRLRKAADALKAGSGRVLEGAVSAVIAGAIGGAM